MQRAGYIFGRPPGAVDTVLGAACRALVTGAVLASGLAAVDGGSPAWGQMAAAAPVAAPALPEPIYWKQHLFLIPYRWGSAAEPASAQVVSLFVSRDRGASWQKISEAKPQVKAFNYRAEGDGEYWFAVKTLDSQGRLWPDGPYQPELRVIVDTTIPRIDELQARPGENGEVDVQCRATDVNLDPASLRVESQTDPASAWQAVALQVADAGAQGMPGAAIRGRWQPLAGARPLAIRATIADRAGNTAVYQARIEAGPALAGPTIPPPPVVGGTAVGSASVNPFGVPGQASGVPTAGGMPAAQQGWTSGAAVAAPLATPPLVTPPLATTSPPAVQSWPAGTSANAPFRLWTTGKSPEDDGLTAYGNPQISNSPSPQPFNSNNVAANVAPPEMNHGEPRVPASYAGIARTTDPVATGPQTPQATGPQFAPLEPFRQAASAAMPTSAPTQSGGQPLVPLGQLTPLNAPLNSQGVTPIDTPPPSHQLLSHQPTSPPKLVGSRTFSLEYDLDDAGRGGVTRVELWGTRDGGQTWNRYCQDDDNRSPLLVTVDNEGLYGFTILVQSAGAAAIESPRAGEEPELWVAVDLKRPIVELTGIERGEGNLADHLILKWRAQDNNLEQRPIALYFSSRPAGPWSAIATSLEDTGQYAWRVERYVPTRIYLRIEARDTAGNLAAFQTREPVEFSPGSLTGRLRAGETR